jgi:putative membrane protein
MTPFNSRSRLGQITSMTAAIALLLGMVAGLSAVAGNDVVSEQRTATATLSAEDKAFIDTAYKGGLAEIQEVKLAQQKAADPELRKAAAQLQKEHEALNSQLSRIGSRYGVALPKEPSPERQAQYQKLQKLAGEDFDRQFIEAGSAAHQKTIALFERTESTTANPDIKTLAGGTLPTLKKHLSMLQGLGAHDHASSY